MLRSGIPEIEAMGLSEDVCLAMVNDEAFVERMAREFDMDQTKGDQDRKDIEVDNKVLKKLKVQQNRTGPGSWCCQYCKSWNGPEAWKCTSSPGNKCQRPDRSRPETRAYAEYLKDYQLMRDDFTRNEVRYTGENRMPFFLFMQLRQREEEDRIGQMTAESVFGEGQSSAMSNVGYDGQACCFQ
jgi:hypothetical protein